MQLFVVESKEISDPIIERYGFGTPPFGLQFRCGWCSGSGNQICSVCNGSGGRQESYTSYDWDGYLQYKTRWLKCFYEGRYTACGYCGGKGYVYK